MSEEVSIEIIANDPAWKALFAGANPEDFFRRKYRDPMYTAAKAAGLIIKTFLAGQLALTVTGWKHRPYFSVRRDTQPGEVHIRAAVTGDNATQWLRIDRGTPPHQIPKGGAFKKGKRVLLRPYLAKTQPGSIVSNPTAGVYGNIEAQAKIIHHPGVTPRQFSKTIADQLRGEVTEEVMKTIRAQIGNIVQGRP